MENLELIIKEYIDIMKEEYSVIGAMLSGSYTTGTMGPNSDIDIFFVWDREDKSMRGREFFKDIEFEYFISPEWKYYDRLKNDLTSQQIYSTGQIIFDTNDIFKNIRLKAIDTFNNYSPELTMSQKMDYSFYIETILKDGIDMLGEGQLANFYFLSGIHIPNFCNIIAKMRKKYPVYEKYAIEQLKTLDERLYSCIMELYQSKEEKDLYNKWTNLCEYIINELGDIDIKDYQVISKLER